MQSTSDWFELDLALTPSDLRTRRASLESPRQTHVSEPAIEYFEGTDQNSSEVRSQPRAYYSLPSIHYEDHHEPPPWNIGFSKQFNKDLSGLDRKLAGRVLETLLVITNFEIPFAVIGDTFKPLSGKLSSCWRYRIGDHRLILQPQPEDSMILVVAFASRGSIYE